MTREQLTVERALEKYVLYVANLLFIATGVAGAVLHHWMLVAFAVLACLINGFNATRLPKNVRKYFNELSLGRVGDPPATSLEKSSTGLIDTSGATNVLVRSAYLCAAFAGAVAWDFGLVWWQIALIVIIVDFLVMSFGAAVIGANSRQA
jgi:hypothetical protein